MDMNLYGKVALVSGCSQGLGYHAALALAKQGADIFGVSIGDDSSLKKAIEATGRNYHSFTISLTTPGAIHQVMKEALAAYGHIDILLNYAAILKKEETLELTKLEWNSAYDINVSAAFFLSLEVIRQFQKQGHGGKIINATGILPRHTSAYCAYAISNGAIEAMTRYLAMEFGKGSDTGKRHSIWFHELWQYVAGRKRRMGYFFINSNPYWQMGYGSR